jgi:hypothetical protein
MPAAQMLDAAFYDLMMETAGAIGGAMRTARAQSGDSEPPPPLLQLRGGYAESPGWFLVQAAEFEPEPLTVTNLRVRDVYASERIMQALLELMAGEGWLEHDGHGAYSLATPGRAILGRMRERRHRLLAALDPLFPEEIASIAALLGRLIDASRACGTPPGTWCLAHSRHRAPAADAPPLVRIFQYFDDVNAFRDDAHMAAWQPLGLDGRTWEAFATICAGGADSAETVFAQLARRGYCRSEYTAALEDLIRRGWLSAGDDGAYAVTEMGRAVREGAEQRTDEYFYAPWSCLGEEEIGALQAALIRVRAGMQAFGG